MCPALFPVGLSSSALLHVCLGCAELRAFLCVLVWLLLFVCLCWAVNMPGNGSSLFSGFRVLGLYSNHIPHALRYHLKHREFYVLTSVGRSFHTFNVRTIYWSWSGLLIRFIDSDPVCWPRVLILICLRLGRRHVMTQHILVNPVNQEITRPELNVLVVLV